MASRILSKFKARILQLFHSWQQMQSKVDNQQWWPNEGNQKKKQKKSSIICLIQQKRINTQDQRIKIQNCNQHPYGCIGLLKNRIGQSTGFLIGPRIVLTVGHSIINENGEIIKDNYFIKDRKIKIKDWKVSEQYISAVKDIKLNKDNERIKQRSRFDYALLLLDEEIHLEHYLQLSSLQLKENQQIHICGYDMESLKKGKGTISRNNKILITYKIDTNQGLSGCPIYIQTKTETKVIGIHIGSGKQQNVGIIFYKQLWDQIQKWKQQLLQQPLKIPHPMKQFSFSSYHFPSPIQKVIKNIYQKSKQKQVQTSGKEQEISLKNLLLKLPLQQQKQWMKRITLIWGFQKYQNEYYSIDRWTVTTIASQNHYYHLSSVYRISKQFNSFKIKLNYSGKDNQIYFGIMSEDRRNRQQILGQGELSRQSVVFSLNQDYIGSLWVDGKEIQKKKKRSKYVKDILQVQMKIDFDLKMVKFSFQNFQTAKTYLVDFAKYLKNDNCYYVSAALNRKNDSITIIPTKYEKQFE